MYSTQFSCIKIFVFLQIFHRNWFLLIAIHRCFRKWLGAEKAIQYIPRNMHTVFALLCLVVVIHWLIFPYPSGLLHWHCGNLTIAPVPAKQPWWIWINTSCEFIMNDCITITKQSTTKPCAYFLGYTVVHCLNQSHPVYWCIYMWLGLDKLGICCTIFIWNYHMVYAKGNALECDISGLLIC